jgi:Abortive infection C-terminus
VKAELISRTTRGLFRSLMTGSTLAEISTAFEDEGFAPDPDCTYEDSSVRRQSTQAYLDAIDWSDPRRVMLALRVFERLMHGFEASYTDQFRQSLRRDGYITDPASGHISAPGPQFAAASLAGLKDPSAIREQLDRIQRAIADDPALAVGSAKELIESTAKVVLAERGVAVSDKADLPELVKQAQQALALHPSSAAPGPDGTDAVKRILGGVSTIAAGLAELRNRGYGTGHGPAAARVGLRARHAHLAVNAAFTWCQLMLDTLADPEAPWRNQSS